MYLDNYIPQIKTICEKHKVKNLLAFGSVLTNEFGDNSDIDLLVDINSPDPIDYAEHYFELKFELEDLLKKPIDLLEKKALKNSFIIKSINENKRVLYEG